MSNSHGEWLDRIRGKKKRMDKLKPCPYRVYGRRTPSATVAGEYFYKEKFMPCMQDGCPCFHVDCGDAYCDRGGAYMKLGKIGEQP